MKIIKGDLIQLALEGQFDVIIHGCNCFNTMGAGIAKEIKHYFHAAYLADIKTNKGDRNKLGNYSKAEQLIMVNGEPRFVTIVNAYIQYGYSKDKPQINYLALDEVFSKIATIYKDKKIGIPKIGAGLAGGDWDIILNIINKHTKNMDITLVEFNGS